MNKKEPSGLRVSIDRMFYDETGQIIVSALFGLSLALLFRRICKDNCVLYSAPVIKDIEGIFYKFVPMFEAAPYSCANKTRKGSD